jgi:hypothetical protein
MPQLPGIIGLQLSALLAILWHAPHVQHVVAPKTHTHNVCSGAAGQVMTQNPIMQEHVPQAALEHTVMARAPHCPPYEHFPEVARALAVNPLLCKTPHRGAASLSGANSCVLLALHRCLISSADT